MRGEAREAEDQPADHLPDGRLGRGGGVVRRGGAEDRGEAKREAAVLAREVGPVRARGARGGVGAVIGLRAVEERATGGERRAAARAGEFDPSTAKISAHRTSLFEAAVSGALAAGSGPLRCRSAGIVDLAGW